MEGNIVPLVAVVVVALLFDLMNGFHDGCNAVYADSHAKWIQGSSIKYYSSSDPMWYPTVP